MPDAWAGGASTCCGSRHSEATLWVDGRSRPGAQHRPPEGAPGRRCAAARARRRGRAARACGRGRVQRHVRQRSTGPTHRRAGRARPLRARALRRAGMAAAPRLRRAAAARGRRSPAAWTRPGAGELLAELNRFCNVWREDDRATWDEAPSDARAAASQPERRRTCTSSRRSGTPTSTPPGCGRWRRPTASACAPSARRPRYMDALPRVPLRLLAGPAVRLDQGAQPRPLRAHPPAGRARAVGAGRRHLGRARLQPPLGRVARAPVPARAARSSSASSARRCREFWNPDVFGYNGQLPQIMRGAGIERFLTQKLSWNRFNAPAYHTFRWQGIDGSEVLAHFPPADTYNARPTVDGAAPQRARLQGSRPLAPQPPAVRLRRRRRRADAGRCSRRCAARATSRACRARRSDDAEEFFDARSSARPTTADGRGRAVLRAPPRHLHLPGRVKRANRKGEVLLHDVELLAALAALARGAGRTRAAGLERLWQRSALKQFHDIMPGSSIAEVYADALADYDEIERGRPSCAPPRSRRSPTGQAAGRSTRSGSHGVAVVVAADGSASFATAAACERDAGRARKTPSR